MQCSSCIEEYLSFLFCLIVSSFNSFVSSSLILSAFGEFVVIYFFSRTIGLNFIRLGGFDPIESLPFLCPVRPVYRSSFHLFSVFHGNRSEVTESQKSNKKKLGRKLWRCTVEKRHLSIVPLWDKEICTNYSEKTRLYENYPV